MPISEPSRAASAMGARACGAPRETRAGLARRGRPGQTGAGRGGGGHHRAGIGPYGQRRRHQGGDVRRAGDRGGREAADASARPGPGQAARGDHHRRLPSRRAHAGTRALRTCLDVSRTSVREALRQLEIEELVSVGPRGRPFVTEISAEAAREIYEFRAVLENGGGRDVHRPRARSRLPQSCRG